MARKKQRSDPADPPQPAIFAEVDTFEELAPRLHELSQSAPPGTRIYVRIRPKADRTVHQTDPIFEEALHNPIKLERMIAWMILPSEESFRCW